MIGLTHPIPASKYLIVDIPSSFNWKGYFYFIKTQLDYFFHRFKFRIALFAPVHTFSVKWKCAKYKGSNGGKNTSCVLHGVNREAAPKVNHCGAGMLKFLKNLQS
jgi:hypothetical protein